MSDHGHRTPEWGVLGHARPVTMRDLRHCCGAGRGCCRSRKVLEVCPKTGGTNPRPRSRIRKGLGVRSLPVRSMSGAGIIFQDVTQFPAQVAGRALRAYHACMLLLVRPGPLAGLAEAPSRSLHGRPPRARGVLSVRERRCGPWTQSSAAAGSWCAPTGLQR
eukprot:scaffold3013_cov316-Prasinococcus_capsulatus_cf.AAC.2